MKKIKKMQEAIPYKAIFPVPKASSFSRPSPSAVKGAIGDLRSLVSENPVTVFERRGCCMAHVVKRLLLGLGVNPAVYEVDEEDESGVVNELEKIHGAGEGGIERVEFPAVFIGARLFGGLDRLMAAHITGELTPILKQAGALWL